jgi:GntR family transcriptional regulator
LCLWRELKKRRKAMFKPNFKSTVPIYEQITAQAKEYVLKGYLKPNEPLPSIRKLATMIGVNPNTVAKAYQELERQHIIVTIRGKGTFVEENPAIEATGVSEFKESLKPVLAEMLLAGMDEERITECVRSVLSELSTKKGE